MKNIIKNIVRHPYIWRQGGIILGLLGGFSGLENIIICNLKLVDYCEYIWKNLCTAIHHTSNSWMRTFCCLLLNVCWIIEILSTHKYTCMSQLVCGANLSADTEFR